MEERIRWLVQDIAQDIVGLDAALFFQAHPNVFDTAAGIAMRMGRRPEEVSQALDRLAAGGILDSHQLGAGRYRCYALRRTEDVWKLLCKLSEMYLDDPAARREIIRMLISRVKSSTPMTERNEPSEEGKE